MYVSRFPPVKRLKEIVLRQLLRVTSEGESPSMVGLLGDHISDEIRIRGSYDADLLDFLERDVFAAMECRSRRAVDVGANIGNHTLRFSKSFAHVDAFEPGFRAAEILETNLRINHISNVRVHRVGLSDRAGRAELLVGKTNLGASHLAETSPVESRMGGLLGREEVPLVRGDDVCEGPVSFLKIDVEGHDDKVLDGFSETLERDHPVLLLEHLATSWVAPSSSVSRAAFGSTRLSTGHKAADRLFGMGYQAFEFRRVREFWPALVDNLAAVLIGHIRYELAHIHTFENRDYPWVLYFHEEHPWRPEVS